MNTSDVSIVLLTRNGGDLFAEVLVGLGRCEGIEETEILMIDSGSEDRTLEHARRHARMRIYQIPPSEFGHGRTRNLAARMTSRPIIAFLVQDATPANPAFLRNLIEPLAALDVAGVYGRQIAYEWTNRIEKMFIAQTYPDRGKDRSFSGSGPVRIREMFFSNVCSAVRRSVWEKIPFDETLIMSEDQAWAKAALQRGHRIVYQPSAVVRHSHNYRLREVFRRNFDSGLSLKGVAEDSFREMIAYELRHLFAGVRALRQSGDATLIPYFFAYEAARSTAFALGRRAHVLPRGARRMFSLNRRYWDQVPTVGSARPDPNSVRM